MDTSGNRRHSLHPKLKELGFAQVASFDDFGDSCGACHRYAGPTVVIIFHPPDSTAFDAVSFYRMGATKPVEVVIAPTGPLDDHARQAFARVGAAAVADSDDPVALIRELAALFTHPARRFAWLGAPRSSGELDAERGESGAYREPPKFQRAPSLPTGRPRKSSDRLWKAIGAGMLAAGVAAGVWLSNVKWYAETETSDADAESMLATAISAFGSDSAADPARSAAEAATMPAPEAGSFSRGPVFDPFLPTTDELLKAETLPVFRPPAADGPVVRPRTEGGVHYYDSLGQLRMMEASNLVDGAEVVVRGVVTFGGGGFTKSRNQFHIQDESGALGVDDPPFRGGATPREGDLVEARGRLGDYRGNLQLTLTAPTRVLARDQRFAAEPMAPARFSKFAESRLVRLERVRRVGGGLPKRPGDESYMKVALPDGQIAEVYIARDTRMAGTVPPGEFALQGILTRWTAARSGGRTTWYVQPRGMEDLILP